MSVKLKTAAAKLAIMVGLVGATLMSCTSENDDAERADLTSALAGHPGSATVSAMQALERGITIAHWSYLMGAEWPDDANRVITDPWLRDAMNVLAASGTAVGTTSLGGIGPRLWGPAPGHGTYDPSKLSATHAEAVAAMRKQNGAATLRTPAAVAEYVRTMTYLVETTEGTQLPAPTTPADEFTGVCVVEFYAGGGSSGPTCSTKPLCCRGSIDYKTGISICVDTTSCKGKGLPKQPGASPSGDGGGALLCGRYQVLDAGNGKYQSGTGLVLDTKTGLTWLRIAYRPNDGAGRLTQSDAESYCSGRGMRLPTKDEAVARGSCDGAWPDTLWTWTSSTAPSGKAYYIVSGSPLEIEADRDPGSYVGALCVR